MTDIILSQDDLKIIIGIGLIMLVTVIFIAVYAIMNYAEKKDFEKAWRDVDSLVNHE